MKLQGRPLSLNLQGEDVQLLQKELRLIGFFIDDKEGFFGKSTEQAVFDFQKKHELKTTGVVDELTAKPINREVDALHSQQNLDKSKQDDKPKADGKLKPDEPKKDDELKPDGKPEAFVVRGQVTQADGSVSIGLTVRAFDKDLPSLKSAEPLGELLGEASTDKEGHYKITYTAEKFRRAEKKTADLIVRVFNQDPSPLASSPIIFNAAPEETVDITLDGTSSSEYERYLTELAPAVENIRIADLTNEDLTFLTGETGINPQHLEFLVMAAGLNEKTKLPPEVFYGLFRQNMPTDLSSLLMQSTSALKQALAASISANIIPARFGTSMVQVLEQLQKLAINLVLEPDRPGGLADILATALPEQTQHEAFLLAYTSHKGTSEEFWNGLRSDERFKNHVDALQFSLGASVLTANHAPLVQMLAAKRAKGEIESLSDLSRFDQNDWKALLAQSGPKGSIGVPPSVPGKDATEKAANYAQVITHRVEDAFPMQFFQHRLKAEQLPGKDDLITFFTNNAEFDLRSTRIESYLNKKPQALGKVNDAESTKKLLKKLQRVYRVAPRYSHMSALIKDGNQSAHDIARHGKNTFINKYGEVFIGADVASRVYDNSRQIEATVLNLFAAYSPIAGRRSMHAAPDEPVRDVDGIPEWSTLFGSIELCDCQHCRSVYSPAAYFVDVLHFLRDRQGVATGSTALSVLFDQRPDLGEIELTCENTNTTLPYVDLVNEILEDAVAPPTPARFTPFVLNADLKTDLNQRTPSARLREAFTPALTADAVVTAGGYGGPWESAQEWWAIDEAAWTYTVRAEAGRGLLVTSRSRQTKGSAEERAASPQYINRRAYDEVLNRAVFPWSLPFELGAAEARVYLDHLGTKRHLIMEAFLPGERETILDNRSVALAHLEMGIKESEIIAGSAVEPLWQQWGFPAENLDAGHSLPDPSDSVGRISSGQWLAVLSGRIDVFLQQSGLTYVELLEFLQTYYINPSIRGTRAIRIAGPGGRDADTCATDRLHLVGLDIAAAARFMRFVRLQRLLGWTIYDLDRTLLAFGPTSDGSRNPVLNDPNFLVKLSQLRRLMEITGLPLMRVLAWWAPPTSLFWSAAYSDSVEQSPYAQIFRGRTTPIGQAGALSEDHSSLSGTLREAGSIVSASLGITSVDLARLAGTTHVISGGLAAPLNLESLTLLYRHATLARSARLAIDDYLTLIALLPTDPFVNPRSCLLFFEKVNRISASGFSVVELDYLLRHRVAANANVAPQAETIATVLSDLRTELQKIAADTAAVSDPKGELTRQKLAQLNWEPALIDQVVARLNEPGDAVGAASFAARALKCFVQDFAVSLAGLPAGLVFPRNLANRLYFDATARPPQLHFRGVMTETERGALLALGTDPADPHTTNYRNAVNALFDQPSIDSNNLFLSSGAPTSDVAVMFRSGVTPGDRFGRLLVKLLPYLRRTLSERLATQKIASALGLDTASASDLLKRWLTSTQNSAQRAIADLLDPLFVESNTNQPITAATFPVQFRTYIRLHKIALIAARLKLSARQLSWLFDTPGAALPDLRTLPATGDETPWPVDDLLRLASLATLRDALPQGESTLDAVFRLASGTSAANLLEQLANVTGWTSDDLGVLTGPDGFNLTLPNALRDEGALVRLQSCFDLMKRVGMSAAQCRRELRGDFVTVAAGQRVMQAARARHEDAVWLALARPLRNALRERQRAALTAYLVGHAPSGRNWRNPDDLYAHFLIDVEMSPCMLTSRIKQAISSVQLFVQRCLMNLLPNEVIASDRADDRWREWRWMKNYRVWEANRKIFLYPENWLEPDLRDDKSPFFRALESELMQGDLTLERAEDAFRRYLEQLDQVARLEVVGTYHQVEQDAYGNTALDVLHVFARTKGDPPVYYYRQRVDSSHWTAWEKIDVDIRGEHLIPVVWQRRIFLFWAIFTEKTRPFNPQMVNGNMRSSTPQIYYEVQLAWTERKGTHWLAKKLTSEQLTTISSRWFFQPLQVSFQTRFEADGSLSILASTEDLAAGVTNTTSQLVFRFDTPQSDARLFSGAAPLLSLMGTWHHTMRLSGWSPELYLPAPLDTMALASAQLPYSIVYQHDRRRLDTAPFFFSSQPVFETDGDVAGVLRSFFVAPKSPGRLRWDETAILNPDVASIALASSGLEASSSLFANTINDAELNVSFPIVQADVALASGGTLPNGGPTTVSLLFTPFVSLLISPPSENRYRFFTFYHPYVSAFTHQLNRDGVDGLLQRDVQLTPQRFLPRTASGAVATPFVFQNTYQPDRVERPIVDSQYPKEDVDFDYDGAYSLYNWELFVHAPLLIADRLSKNQRFEDAQKWLHYIFNPTDTSGLQVPQRYWQTRKFHETTRTEYAQQQIQRILHLLAEGADPARRDRLNAEDRSELANLEAAVRDWRKKPFTPHAVARLRTVAYQKAVVMKYLDNLIAWGDQLFRRDTIEAMNEAAQLYVLAAEILGRLPQKVPARSTAAPHTYNSLAQHLDEFSNALVEMEALVSPPANGTILHSGAEPTLTLPAMLYFCVPRNDRLLGYWDKVADRLFKIRHCMNIEGVVRQLPLFEPPIDPGLLARAVAAGVDLGSVLRDTGAALPHYRFNILAGRATELTGEVKALGAALLAALEKGDAESIALLRAHHEKDLLTQVEQVRTRQLEEASRNLDALIQSRELAVARYTHYQMLLGQSEVPTPALNTTLRDTQSPAGARILSENGVKLIQHEKDEQLALSAAHLSQELAGAHDMIAALLHLIPMTNVSPWGVGGSLGGSNFGHALGAIGAALRMAATQSSFEAGRSARMAQFIMREHDWVLQSNLAAREIMHIDKQITAATVRRDIAQQELNNHRRQMQHSAEVEAFLQDKYTNQELYGWMVGQLADIYFQAYQLAYDMARRTERAFRFELGLTESSFIQFGYWDSLKKGLLAGEKLHHDLKRLEMAYLDQNRREYEITKSISLLMLNPLQLLELRTIGKCEFDLPERLFDLDFPGHYMRRIKSVSLTIPCVTGPYTGINCTLTLLSNKIRIKNSPSLPYEGDDDRFVTDFAAIQSITTSHGQNDSGLFELNFRDERYVPFEYAGVISRWRIEMPKECNQFDFDTISDVVLHLKYTARDGGETLKTNALEAATPSNGIRLFSAKHEFPGEWHSFLHPASDTGDQTLSLPLTKSRFPFLFQSRPITINTIELFIEVKDGRIDASTLNLSPAPDHPISVWNGGMLHAEKSVNLVPDNSGPNWRLSAWLTSASDRTTHTRFDANAIEDIIVVCRYSVTR